MLLYWASNTAIIDVVASVISDSNICDAQTTHGGSDLEAQTMCKFRFCLGWKVRTAATIVYTIIAVGAQHLAYLRSVEAPLPPIDS